MLLGKEHISQTARLCQRAHTAFCQSRFKLKDSITDHLINI